jgi:ATP/maltotriose-dependent transcriptional regulator MalT
LRKGSDLDGLIPEFLELGDRLYEPLSQREIEIMCYYANPYYEYNFISEQLNISVNTVKTHIAHIFDKLGEADRYSASLTFFRLYPKYRKIIDSLMDPAA